MKTLASRFLISEKAGKAARVAAIAAPMLLVECQGAPRNEPKPSTPVVVIEAQAEGDYSKGDEAALKEMGSGAEPAKAATILNANIYPGCKVEARLSVVNLDNSLNRVVLDPSVDFFAEIQPETGKRYNVVGESKIRVCHKVAECDMAEYVRTGLPLRHNLQSDREVVVTVSYSPARGDGFAPSETTLRITHEELVSYCP